MRLTNWIVKGCKGKSFFRINIESHEERYRELTNKNYFDCYVSSTLNAHETEPKVLKHSDCTAKSNSVG